MANVFIRATVPETLFNAWLQHLRDFDAKNPGCHFEVCADMPDMPMAEMVERLRVEPKLKFVDFFERKTDALAPLKERTAQRPPNFESLSPQEQWAIDKELGILDWDGK